MGSKCTKRYSDEYKRDAIELVRSSGRTVTEVARQLDVSAESLRARVKKAKAAEAAKADRSAASLSDCPSRHRRHTSRFCSSDNPGRPILAPQQHLQ
ncbi:transposase [Streptomyces sp. NPDC001732]